METYLSSIWLQFLLLSANTYGKEENTAFCFLTRQLIPETLIFAQRLADELIKHHIKIFIMIDDNNFNVKNINTSNNLDLFQIPNELTIEHHYEKTIYVDNDRFTYPLTAWDKALFYFNLLHPNYTFVWLCEDDVFIPSVQAFLSVHELYSHTTDLIVPRMDWNLLGDTSKWRWHAAFGQFVPPWAHSMVNLVGFSRRMLVAIDDYVHWLGRVAFHEFSFHIIAIHMDYIVVTPTEFSTIDYRAYFSYEQFIQEPNNIYHPFKEVHKHFEWREGVIRENIINNTSVNLTDIETLCSSHRNMGEITNYLKDLLKNFKICKGRFSASDRRLLRKRFSKLRKECLKQNASDEIVTLTIQLADHAMKSPEPMVTNLITNKSSYHIQLERELKANKETICQLSRNGSAVGELRQHNEDLVRKLTFEIQREYKIQAELEKQRNLSSNSSVPSFTDIYMIISNESVFNITFKINFLRNRYYIGNNDKLMILTIGVIFLIFIFRLGRIRMNRTEGSV